MSEVKIEVKTVKIDYKCPKCLIGYLRPTGVCYPMNPPSYPHKCNNCDHMESFSGKTYPYISYE